LRIAKQQQRELVAAIDAQSNPNDFVNASCMEAGRFAAL
jgi:hypothetical protein